MDCLQKLVAALGPRAAQLSAELNSAQVLSEEESSTGDSRIVRLAPDTLQGQKRLPKGIGPYGRYRDSDNYFVIVELFVDQFGHVVEYSMWKGPPKKILRGFPTCDLFEIASFSK